MNTKIIAVQCEHIVVQIIFTFLVAGSAQVALSAGDHAMGAKVTGSTHAWIASQESG